MSTWIIILIFAQNKNINVCVIMLVITNQYCLYLTLYILDIDCIINYSI